MKSKEENEKKKKDWEESYDEKAEKLGLSDEAKMSEEEKEQVMDLGNNRYLVSSSPIDEDRVRKKLEEKDEDEEEEAETEASDEGGRKRSSSTEFGSAKSKKELDSETLEKIADIVKSKLDSKSDASDREVKEDIKETDIVKSPESNPLEDPLNLVKLLSTYKVSLDSPVRDLIKRIKARGEDHLLEEIEKLKGD